MSKSVKKKEENAVAPFQNTTWGAEEITQEDIVLPKILLMQATSKLVHDGVAKPGEFRDSLNADKILGSTDKPVQVIIFGSYKTWLETVDGEYNQMIAYTPETANIAKEETGESGEIFERKLFRNYHCLLVDDIKDSEPFPYVLSFKGMSSMAGKILATHMMKLQVHNKPSASRVFELGAEKTENDKGKFHVMNIKMGRQTTNEEISTAWNWHQLLIKSNVKVDDSNADEPVERDVSANPDSTQAEKTQEVQV